MNAISGAGERSHFKRQCSSILFWLKFSPTCFPPYLIEDGIGIDQLTFEKPPFLEIRLQRGEMRFEIGSGFPRASSRD